MGKRRIAAAAAALECVFGLTFLASWDNLLFVLSNLGFSKKPARLRYSIHWRFFSRVVVGGVSSGQKRKCCRRPPTLNPLQESHAMRAPSYLVLGGSVGSWNVVIRVGTWNGSISQLGFVSGFHANSPNRIRATSRALCEGRGMRGMSARRLRPVASRCFPRLHGKQNR